MRHMTEPHDLLHEVFDFIYIYIYIHRSIDLMGFRSYINEFGREAFAIEWDLVAIWPLNWFF